MTEPCKNLFWLYVTIIEKFSNQRKHRMKHLLLFMTALMLCLCGCREETVQNKKLVMVTNATFPPYEYVDKGEIEGIDPAVIRKISRKLGYELEIQDMAFDAIIAAVQTGKAQIAASGITVTEDRKKKVLFTDPYVIAAQVMIVPKNSPIKTAADLKGKRIGVQHGTTGDTYVKENIQEPQRFQHGPDAVTALVSGKLDVVVIDGEPAEAYVSKNPQLKILPEPLVQEEYAFAMGKENKALLDKFNAELRKMKENGELSKIINHYRDLNSKVKLTVFLPPVNAIDGKYLRSMMDQLADRFHFRADYHEGGQESIAGAIQSDTKQIIAVAVSLSQDQKKLLPFTETLVLGEYALVVPQTSGIKDFSMLNGKKIGAVKGTFAERYIEKNIHPANTFTDAKAALDAISSGQVDAAVVERATAQKYLSGNGKLKIFPENFVREEYIFLVGKENIALLQEFAGNMKKMQSSGDLQKILDHANAVQNEKVVYSAAAMEKTMDEDSLWGGIKFSFYNNFVKDRRYTYLISGFWVTIKITVLAVLMGIVIGFFVAVIRSTADLTGKLKLLDGLCRVYLTVIRGTPVVVQLLIIYFVIFGSINVDKVLVAVIAFGINSGAYVAEIIRGGIMSIDKGQMEAGQSLGLTYWQSMREIILPQAFKNVLPALGNEFIVLLKETSVAGYIALQDLTRGGDIIRSQTYDAFFPLIAVALIYLMVVMFLSWLLGCLEKRLKRNE